MIKTVSASYLEKEHLARGNLLLFVLKEGVAFNDSGLQETCPNREAIIQVCFFPGGAILVRTESLLNDYHIFQPFEDRFCILKTNEKSGLFRGIGLGLV